MQQEPKYKFHLTFGQKSPLRNGWIEIEASSREDALEAARYAFGENFAEVYDTVLFDIGKFPAGRFGEVLRGK